MKKYFVVLMLLLTCGVWAARTPAQAPNYVGDLDRADCNNIGGWAADRNRVNTPINVSIFDGPTLLTTVLANGSRGDSAAIGAAVGAGDNGLHAFDIPTPASLKNGQPHSISVRFESSSTQLPNSPKSITCVLPTILPSPKLPTLPPLVRLDLSFKLANGAASTKSRLVGLNFEVREVASGLSHDVKGEVTAYRVREEPDSRDSVHDLSAQSWIPITHGLIMELGERNAERQRYGERRVAFQVKTPTLTSEVVSDTIALDPVLKEYRVSAQGDTHPLIQYAASQGFTFRLDVHETTCGPSCPTGTGGGAFDRDIATGTASVGTGEFISSGSTKTCVTKASYVLFDGRSPNTYWRIKSVVVPGSQVGSPGPNRFEVRFSETDPSNRCSIATIKVGEVVVEGPEVDDFIDPANPWKNAFVRPLSLTRPLVKPGIRQPN